MVTARLAPMPEDRLAAWRESATATGNSLPEPTEGDGYDVVEITVDDVRAGGAVITYDHDERGRRRSLVRHLQTTVPHDAAEPWAAVLTALEEHVRARDARVVVTAVPPALSGVFGRAGYRATMTTVSKRMDPESVHELQEDRRVTLRAMDPDERRRYAEDAVGLMRSGMERAGVTGTDVALGDLAERIAGLGGDSLPDEELLLVGLLDGVPIGRLWATLVTSADGALDFHGHAFDLFPEFRGQRLSRSFLGALRRHLDSLGVGHVQGRLYGHDASARRTVVEEGAGIDVVHLRKDLG